MLQITADQPGTQQDIGIDVTGADHLAVAGLNRHRLARLEIAQRGGLDIDFVAVDPQMAGAQAAVFILAQAQRGKIGGGNRGRHGMTNVG